MDFERVAAEYPWGGTTWQYDNQNMIHQLNGHQVLKPVKKGDEYIVKWYYNGKKVEGRTYYTDDRDDANDTYLMMVKQAKELNEKVPYIQENIFTRCYVVYCIKDNGTKEYLGKNHRGETTLLPSSDIRAKQKATKFRGEEEIKNVLIIAKSTFQNWKWDKERVKC